MKKLSNFKENWKKLPKKEKVLFVVECSLCLIFIAGAISLLVWSLV